MIPAYSIEGDKIGGKGSTHGKIKLHTTFQLGNLNGTNHLKYLSTDGNIILN
jgi:hypothetical protein